jgi:integrase
MASIWQLDGSPYWIARFRDKQGKRKNRSTKIKATEKNRKEALKKAEGYEDAWRKEREAEQTQKVIEEGHASITGEVLNSVTLREFVTSWLAEKEGDGISKGTKRFYEAMCKAILDYFGEKSDLSIRRITRDDIVAFRDHQQGKGRTKTTVRHQFKVLRMIFLAAYNQGKVSQNHAGGVGFVKEKKKQIRRPMTKEEIKSLLPHCDKEWRSMVLCALYTGQRLSDIASLTWGNFDMKTGRLKLTQRKTGNEVEQIIGGPFKRLIESMTAGGKKTPLHPRAWGSMDRTGRSNGLSTKFSEIMAKAGLREPQKHTKTHGRGSGIGSGQNEITFHSLRYSAVQIMVEAGVSLSVVKELVGHEALQMTLRYLQASKEARIHAAESFPDIEAEMNEAQEG